MNRINPIIYGLVDPLEPEHIRYIGIATNLKRPKQHQYEIFKYFSGTHKENWILKLLTEDRMYQIIVIEEFPVDTDRLILRNAEINHIAEKKRLGHKLTNATAGGDGTYIRTPEQRERQRQAILGTKQTEESIIKRSTSNSKKWKEQEYYTHMVEVVKNRWKDPNFIVKLSESNRRAKKTYIEHSSEITRLNQRIHTHSRIIEVCKDPIRISRSLIILEHLLNKFSKLQQELV